MRKIFPGKQLTAPGILRNPVDVNALYDQDAAHQAMLRNLLQRKGYKNGIDTVLEVGIAKGKAEMLIHLIQVKFGVLAQTDIKKIHQLDEEMLLACTERLFNAESIEQLFK